MPTPSAVITCTENRVIANHVHQLRFTKPESFLFKPGQFVLFDVPLIDNPTDIQTRAFSIASAPSESDLLFVVKLKPGGRASRFIAESLKPGDTLRIQGPFGVFIIDRTKQKDWLLVCTSAGVAPFRSQLIAFLQEEKRRIDLIFGVHSEEDFFWVDDLKELERKHKNFHLHLTVSIHTSSWRASVGHVQTIMPKVIHDWSKVIAYICGNPEMTKDVKRICIEEYGMNRTEVHMEGYI